MSNFNIDHIIRGVISVLIFSVTSLCFSQNNFINYSTKEGLPSNQVYDIYQDEHEVMWFATDRGLSSFNGSFFTNYSTLDGLLSDVIYDFFPQENGLIWCSNDNGQITILNPLDATFTPFKFNHLLPQQKEHEIKSILIDNGNFYFKFKGMTGYLMISSQGEVESHELSASRTRPKYYYIHKLKDDFYYYSDSSSGAINELPLELAYRDMISANQDHVARINYNNLEILYGNKFIRKINLLDRGELLELGVAKNNFWVTGYNIGTKIINKKGQILETYLPELPCSHFLRDKEDGIWISTLSDGVFYAPSTDIKILDCTKNEHITSLSSSGKKLAFGTHSGKVIEYFIENNKTIEKIASGKGIVQYHNNILYSNINDQESEVLSSFIRKISDNNNEDLLLVTSHIVYDVHKKKSLMISSFEVFDAEKLENDLLISQGTSILLTDSNNVEIKKVDLKTITYDIDVYDNYIFCATSSKGLLIINKDLKLVRAIDIKSGLKSNFVNEVTYRKDDLWLATRNGLTRIVNFGKKNESISSISMANGLTDTEVTDVEFLGDTLFVGTRKGVNFFEISNWNNISSSNNSIYFSTKRISQNGEEILSTKNLDHNENNLTIEIELVAYNLNKSIFFRYKLDGMDNDWTITRSRVLNFKSLPPGEYTLVIEANVNGIWNEKILKQEINIRPAWYATWWFIILIIFLVTSILWLFFKYRILNYNREIIREILRQILKRIKSKENIFYVRSNGHDVKVISTDVLYIESSGNYINIHTSNEIVVVRKKISDFLDIVPDPMEYLQIRRSIIVRIDKVKSKSTDSILINDKEIKVGVTYMKNFKMIQL